MEENQFEAIFNHNSEPMGISCKGIFQLCNQSFLTIFGYTSNDELIGRPVLDVIAPECHESVKDYIAKRSRNESIPTYFDFIGVRKDGSHFDFEISSSNYSLDGKVFSIVIGRDVTEIKKIQKDLLLSEEKFRIAFNSNPSVVAISTLDEGRYLEINDRFTQVLGWSRQEAINHTSKDLHIFLEYGKRQEMVRVMRENGNIRNFEINILTKQGEIKTVEFNADLIHFHNQPCLLAQLQDITDRKLAETALKSLNDELEIRVRNRTKDLEASTKELEAFSYSISHDLKAPLRAINSFCKLFMEENSSTISSANMINLTKVRDASLYMNQLIDDLLNLYKIKNSVLKIEKVDASCLVEEILARFQGDETGRTVTIQIQKDVTIWGDKKQVRVILENLLENAWKFTSTKNSAQIEFGSYTKEDETILFVRDNGVGFNMNFVNKLFGTFQKLHAPSEFPGTGIGLAMIQKIIHLHRGKIWVESEIEKGSTFFFTIPNQVP